MERESCADIRCAEQPAGKGGRPWLRVPGWGGRKGDLREGHQDTRHCSLLNRGTSTQTRHDNHTPDLHMHQKLKQGSTHLQTHTYTHTHTCKGVARTRHNRGRTSAHAHTAGQTGGRFCLHWQSLQMSVLGRSTGPTAACERGCTSGSSGPPRYAGVAPWRKVLSAT